MVCEPDSEDLCVDTDTNSDTIDVVVAFEATPWIERRMAEDVGKQSKRSVVVHQRHVGKGNRE